MRSRRFFSLFTVLSLLATLLAGGVTTAAAQQAGSALAKDVTATSPENGGRVRLDDVSSFDPGGGEAVFEPDSAQAETFTYAGTDQSTNELVGLDRPSPTSHPTGSFVAVEETAASASPSPSATSMPTSPDSTSPPQTETSTTSDASTDSSSSTPTTSTTSSAGDIPDPCGPDAIDCGTVIQRVIEMLAADPCDPYNGGIDCDNLLQDVLEEIALNCDPSPSSDNPCVDIDIGEPADPCNPDDGGVDCNRIIQDVLESLSTDPCDPYNGGFDCNALVQRVLELLNTDPCDPYNGGVNCQAILQSIMDAIHDTCPGGVLVCTDPYVDLVSRLIDDLYYDVCGGDLSYCQAKYQAIIQGLIDSVVIQVCNGGVETCDDIVFDLADLVSQVVNDLYYDVCGGDLSYCQAKYQAILQALIDSVVVKVCTGGISTCDDLVIGIANDAIDELSRIIDDLYYDVCGGDLSYCQAKYQAIVQALIDSVVIKVCTGGLSTCDDVVIAVITKLVNDAYQAVNDLYYDICGGDLSYCQAKYQKIVQDTIDSVAVRICAGGLSTCDELIVGLVDQTVDSAYGLVCGTDEDPKRCADGYKEVVIGLVGGVVDTIYRVPCPADTSEAACVDRYKATVSSVVEAVVQSIYEAACPSDASADACVSRHEDEVTSLVGGLVLSAYRTVCTQESTLDPASASSCSVRYADSVSAILIGAADSVYRTACPMQSLILECANEYADQLSDLAETTAGTIYDLACPDGGTANDCANRHVAVLLGVVNDIVEQYCTSGVDSCGSPYRELVDELIALIHAIDPELVIPDPSTPCPEGSPPWEAEELPPIIPGRCQLVGLAILDYAVGAHVPLPGEGVRASAGLQVFGMNVQVDGTVILFDVGDEGPEPPAVIPPAAPTNLSASAESWSRVRLTWTDNSINESGFAILRGTQSGGPYERVGTVPSGKVSFVDESVGGSRTYYYVVRAYNNAGETSSNQASVTTPPAPAPPPAPAAPTSLTATGVSSSQVNLRWADNATNETGFRIERSTSSGGPFSEIAVVSANTTWYTDGDLASETTYHYRVRAFNSGGISATSNVASATTDAGPGAGSGAGSGGTVDDPLPTSSPSPTPSPSSTAEPDLDSDDIDAETGAAGTGGCKDDFYRLSRIDGQAIRLYNRLGWRFRRESAPDYMSSDDKDRALARIKDAGEHMARGYTTCRNNWAKGDPVPDGNGFDYEGITSKAADLSYVDKDKDGDKEFVCGEYHYNDKGQLQKITSDGISQVEFGSLDTPGTECTWVKAHDGPDKIIESDIRIRHHISFKGGSQEEWYTQNKVPDRCQQNPNLGDLEGIMTHERGHSMGLGDIYDHGNGHPNLTMGRSDITCSKHARSLGKGDVLGLKDLYSR